ncbi:LAFE_0B10220g1_1 [Lachancea fermentati]|uniref:Guanine nucleotide-binding protein subunit gamma n=1 Tax=Lachancea fermentati TaxID=4955 RepID=A0A1G4M8I7_LACFM|nr:LAFE_0B10220g1_1 [Lachancea fermentati]
MTDGDVPIRIEHLKLKRINELNKKLRQELSRERISASNACLSIIDYTTSKRDYAIPDIWGYPAPGTNPYRENIKALQKLKSKSSQDSNTCCIIM